MRAVGAGALLVLAWPATAHAVTYGGGTPADSVASAQRQLTLVGLRTGANGQARVWVKVAARCGVASAAGPTTVNPDGTFAFRQTVSGVRRTTRIRMAGRVGATSATGTASAKLTLRRHGHVAAKCSSGTRGWQARDPAPLGAPSPGRANTALLRLHQPGNEPPVADRRSRSTRADGGSPPRRSTTVIAAGAGGASIATTSRRVGRSPPTAATTCASGSRSTSPKGTSASALRPTVGSRRTA